MISPKLAAHGSAIPMLQTLALPSDRSSLKFTDKFCANSLNPSKSGRRSPSIICAAFVAGQERVLAPRRKTAHAASLYDVLQIDHRASLVEIKTAYRRLAKLHHPDTSFSSGIGEPEGHDFIEIHNAYETLSDPAARALYDLSLGLMRSSDTSSFQGRGSGFYQTRRWETDQCW